MNLFLKKYVPDVPSSVNFGISPTLNPVDIPSKSPSIVGEAGSFSYFLIKPVLLSGGARKVNFIFFLPPNVDRDKLFWFSSICL